MKIHRIASNFIVSNAFNGSEGAIPMTKLTAVLSMTVLAGGLFAQDPTINQRRENQQDRIAQGVKNGTLTAGQTAKLETKEAKLNKQIRTARKANGGNLTRKLKKQINGKQNKLSKKIYKDKHS
jgi:hypothetical protein